MSWLLLIAPEIKREALWLCASQFDASCAKLDVVAEKQKANAADADPMARSMRCVARTPNVMVLDVMISMSWQISWQASWPF